LQGDYIIRPFSEPATGHKKYVRDSKRHGNEGASWGPHFKALRHRLGVHPGGVGVAEGEGVRVGVWVGVAVKV
jgi:hypothetical protein